jgi:hypothetical protein
LVEPEVQEAGLQAIAAALKKLVEEAQLTIVNVGGQLMTARLGARERPKPDEAHTLSVDTSGINLFDPETENRI